MASTVGLQLEATVKKLDDNGVPFTDGTELTFKGKSIQQFINKNKRKVILGSGKDGLVFKMKVKDSNGGFANVAIKQLKMAVNSKTVSVEQKFASEFQDATKQVHKNLVFFYGAVKFENHALIIMDLCLGDLKKLVVKIRKNESMMEKLVEINAISEDQKTLKIIPEIMTCRMFACVVTALNFLYTKYKIYHSDIKPANILYKKVIDDTGRQSVIFKLGDFSSAAHKIQSELSGAVPVANTKLYITPEIANNPAGFIGQTTDIWALGITLGEFATGNHPIKHNVFLRGGKPKENVTVADILKDLKGRSMESEDPAYPIRPLYSTAFMDMYRLLNQADTNKRYRYAHKDNEKHPRRESYCGPDEGLMSTQIYQDHCDMWGDDQRAKFDSVMEVILFTKT